MKMSKSTEKININLIMLLITTLLAACSGLQDNVVENQPANKPNILVIFADDLGYGDLSAYQGKGIQTPHIDSIGEQGFISRDFFIPANVCSPSRASLLTGRYPSRNGIPVALHPWVPKHLDANYGLSPQEVTIPEMIKPAGYRSLMVGKWHLGQFSKGHHPIDAGFDEYFGLDGNYYYAKPSDPKYPYAKHNSTLYRGKAIAQKNARLEEVTTQYTDEVINFIQREKDQPFFIYLAHQIVHAPHKPSAPFKGTSARGKYGDFIHEMDHSTGRILQALKTAGIEDNTLVIFTSDNGANFQGDNGILNGGKYTTMEGGHIVPALIKWPGHIPAGQDSDVTISSLDIFPLIAQVTGAELPDDRVIDGKNILPILTGESKQSPHQVLYYYNGLNLQAVRKGRWKLHLPRTIADQPFWHKNSAGSRTLTKLDKIALFDLKNDREEKHNVADSHPDIVASFQPYIDKIIAELGDVDKIGSDKRLPPFKNVQEINRWWVKKK